MKKLFVLILMMCTLATFAQKPSFRKNDQVGNLMIGFGNAMYSGSYYSTKVPAISLSYEMGIFDNFLNDAVIGVGGYVGYGLYEWEYNNSGYGYRYSNFVLAGRGVFHYPFVDNLDTYGGLIVGLNVHSEKSFGSWAAPIENDLGNPFFVSPFVGARYYLTPEFAGVAEVGWGVAYLNLGIAYKF